MKQGDSCCNFNTVVTRRNAVQFEHVIMLFKDGSTNGLEAYTGCCGAVSVKVKGQAKPLHDPGESRGTKAFSFPVLKHRFPPNIET
jgi:hypothetical protein